MTEKRPNWAQRISEARGKKGISQRDLVKKMGINQTSLVHYETGKIKPRICFLINFIKEIGVDGDWLLTGRGDMFGESKKKITKEEAIEALFGDKADDLVSYLLEAMKDPFLRAVLYTKCIEHKSRQQNG